jgi:vesicle coat complex subunit
MGLFGPPNVEKAAAADDLDKLIAALGYRKDRLVQVAACRALTERVDKLVDYHWEVTTAVENDISTGKVGDSVPMRLALKHQSIGNALTVVREPAVEPLLARIRSYGSVYEFWVRESVETIPGLGLRMASLLEDPDPSIRDLATYYLSHMERDPNAAAALVAALSDSSDEVRRQAARGLGKTGNAESVEPLIAALQDPDETVRQYAARSLGELADSRSVDALINSLVYDGSRSVRASAAQALGAIGGVQARDRLLAALADSDPFVRMAAVGALSRLGDVSVIPWLTRVAHDPDRDVRRNVKKALAALQARSQ